MTTVYFEEITSDDEGPALAPDGSQPEELDPCELPVHTLTAADVAAHKAGAPAAVDVSDEALGVESSKENAEALRLKGNTAFGAKKFDEALKLYTEAIVMDGANGLLYGNRAATLLQMGRAEQAITDAKQMVLLLPDLAKSHFRLGCALSALGGKPSDAAKALLAGLEIEPSNDAIAEALKKELARPALKKGKQHAPLVQQCTAALAARHGGGGGPPVVRMSWKDRTWATPPSRGGSVLAAAAGRLWLIAGADRTGNVYNDVWEYDPAGIGGGGTSQAWRTHTGFATVDTLERNHEATAAADGIRSRAGHAACALPEDARTPRAGAIAVFGGQDPSSSVLFSDVNILRIGVEGAKWDGDVPAPTGPTPAARNGHTFTLDAAGRAIVVFGGADADGHRSDVHRLSLAPNPLVGYSDELMAEAGITHDGVETKLITSGERVEMPEYMTSRGFGCDIAGGFQSDGTSALVWDAPAVSGPTPTAREMHVAGVVRRTLIVHGGRGGDELLSDVCVLDLTSWTWMPPMPSVVTRVGHTAMVMPPTADSTDDGRMLIFGGFSGDAMCNDTQEITYSGGAVDIGRLSADASPPRRFAHCAAVLGESIFIFGGSAPTEDLADLHEAQPAAALAARRR